MLNDRSGRRLSRPAFVILVLIAVTLGAFSLFVGYNKALAQLAVLREHSAWTIHLPVLLGRVIGWAEIVAAALLIVGLFAARLAHWGSWAAVWITLNHVVAAVVHVFHAEWHTLTQSAVVIVLCLVMVWLYRQRASANG